MDDVYDALRKSENIIIDAKEEELIAFLEQFFNIIKIDAPFDPESTLYYAETFDVEIIKNIKCMHLWSAAIIAPEIRKIIPSDKKVIENKSIKDEYIMRFLRNCSI
jgi:hypothetical protein